jgi:demethylmenaquinone methyltransferase / 2-methoxy-6-polyprenyl-1,4-benzoquinol methylase
MSNAENRSDGARDVARLAAYYADPARRLPVMRELFNRSARHYDAVNRLVSLGSGGWYRRFCLRRSGLRQGMQVVDIATGTGLLAREALSLTRDPGSVIGIDVSEAMLAIAQRNLGIPLIQAAAEALPLAPGIADVVTMGYGLRHVADLETAFAEARRILRPGGVMVLLEISAPRNKVLRAMAGGFIGSLIPRLWQLLRRDARARSLMQYHWQTIVSYMPPEVVLRAMTNSGFEQVACNSYLDLFHHYTGRKSHSEA